MYRFNAIHIKLSAGLCVEIYKLIIKCYGKAKDLEQLKEIWKKNKAGELALPHLSLSKSYSNQDC